MKKQLEIGVNFGDLTIIEYLGSIKYNNTYLCKCICGNTREVTLTHLNKQLVTNCGCKNFEKDHANLKFGPEEASFRGKASNYKANAKQRGILFDLTIDETVTLLKGDCFYCNEPPQNIYNVKQSRTTKKLDNYYIKYNGIDRVDNTKGYVIDNVVSCCTKCNTAKLNFTLLEFKEWVNKIYFKLNENENIMY